MNNIVVDDEIEMLERQANLYLSGLSLREIACKEHVSHITVRRNITERLKRYNNILYCEVIDAIKGNSPQSVKIPQVAKRVLESYYYLVNYDKTFVEIAEIENVTPNQTYRDLTFRLRELNKIDPEKVTDQMVLIAQEILQRHALENLEPGPGIDPYLQNRDEKGRFAK